MTLTVQRRMMMFLLQRPLMWAVNVFFQNPLGDITSLHRLWWLSHDMCTWCFWIKGESGKKIHIYVFVWPRFDLIYIFLIHGDMLKCSPGVWSVSTAASYFLLHSRLIRYLQTKHTTHKQMQAPTQTKPKTHWDAMNPEALNPASCLGSLSRKRNRKKKICFYFSPLLSNKKLNVCSTLTVVM